MTKTTNAVQRTNSTATATAAVAATKPATVIHTISQIGTQAANSSPVQQDVSYSQHSVAYSVPSSSTNIVVRSIEEACVFYTQAFGWTIISQSSTTAILQFNDNYFYLVAEQYVCEYFGYTAVSPQTSGHSSAMTTTLVCEDVESTWNNALQAGAIPVKSPFKKSNGCLCATLVGPDNYIWFITNNSNFFTV